MKLGISWVVNDLTSYPELVRGTEAAGFDVIGVPDTQASTYRECYVAMTTCLLSTERIRAVTLVTNPITRHPAVTASALASLAELSGGRAMLGIGTGDTGVFNLGLTPAKVATLREYLLAVQTLLKAQPAQWKGRTSKLIWPKEGVPVLVAGEGERVLGLAGEVANAALAGGGVAPGSIRRAIESLKAGAEKAGRDPQTIELWWMLRGSLADSYEEALEWGLPGMIAGARHSFRSGVDGKDLPESLKEPMRQLQLRYDVTAHNQTGAGNPNGRLARELGLADFLAESFGLVGTPRQIVDRLRSLKDQGVENVIMRIGTPDRLRFLKTWREEVAPKLK
ncbi:MAG: LLM class flavin-dependent oxidoreductase [Chloroflexi bacterium]|nr:LLM class flavin-dependent oxidoreductase [Chloroflexota bacterium]